MKLALRVFVNTPKEGGCTPNVIIYGKIPKKVDNMEKLKLKTKKYHLRIFYHKQNVKMIELHQGSNNNAGSNDTWNKRREAN